MPVRLRRPAGRWPHRRRDGRPRPSSSGSRARARRPRPGRCPADARRCRPEGRCGKRPAGRRPRGPCRSGPDPRSGRTGQNRGDRRGRHGRRGRTGTTRHPGGRRQPGARRARQHELRPDRHCWCAERHRQHVDRRDPHGRSGRTATTASRCCAHPSTGSLRRGLPVHRSRRGPRRPTRDRCRTGRRPGCRADPRRRCAPCHPPSRWCRGRCCARARRPARSRRRGDRHEGAGNRRSRDGAWDKPIGRGESRREPRRGAKTTKGPQRGPFRERNPAASYSPRESPPKYHRRWWA